MHNAPVVFIAFQEQDNLGVGYVGSMLLKAGFDIKIIDFRLGKKNILKHIIHYNPLVVGFSVIFQYHLYDFKDLIRYLRIHGVNCHFSAGGHYPSLRYIELLHIIPELDSVVLFEGEYTFLELIQSIYEEKEWRQTLGIAYKNNGSIVANSLRPLEKDLDNFPLPIRPPLKEYALGKKFATILAGRGCYYNCSFCSIREFYSKPSGPIKRVRHPEMVVREIELLYQQLDCSIFMFQDDDFPVASNKGKKWVANFCELLSKKRMKHKILWKINCRPDEVELDTFKLMKDSGLFLVYLGIEAGTDDGLQLMNKRMTTDKAIKSVSTLKELNIAYDFGFMLFDPWSTYQSIMDNLDFLEKIISDGSSPITFCKMIPYAETKIEHKLRQEGRLKQMAGFEDYDFCDASLNHFYRFIVECFEDWIGKHDGILNLARWARYYSLVYKKYFPITSQFRDIDESITDVISDSNNFFINIVKILVSKYSSIKNNEYDFDKLMAIRNKVSLEHSHYKTKLINAINNIERLIN